MVPDFVRDRVQLGPTTMTILATYQCTAACQECCFECGPQLHQRLSLPDILDVIDRAREFSTLKMVVFSGGECFLLRGDLVTSVKRASSQGLSVRCVTNGYWATSRRAALARLEPLVDAGLTELNLSTGDDHQKFVPYDRVAIGAACAAELGIQTLIAVEGSETTAFTVKQAMEHRFIQEFWRMHPNTRHKLQVISNIWIPFHNDRNIVHNQNLIRDPARRMDVGGCDNILENFVVTPAHQAASCCGLTMEYIPALKVGDVRTRQLVDLYDDQFQDFLKIWLNVDGPENILLFARQYDDTIDIDAAVHPCQACVSVHQNSRVQEVLAQHYPEVMDSVMTRFLFKKKFTKALEGAAQEIS